MDYLPTKETMIIITMSATLLLVGLELIRPARRYPGKTKLISYLTNGALFIFNNITTYLLQIGIVYMLASEQSHTLFTSLPPVIAIIVGVLILDASIYLWHRLNHTVPLLWQFHQCHHSDTYLNATSAIRFHIGELLFSALFKSLLLIITGIPFTLFVFYESLITLFALFHHTNIALPTTAQSLVSKILITPALHRVHHSNIRKEHDTNFGVMLSIWDRLFHTLHDTYPKHIGLSYGGEKTFFSFLIFPLWKNNK